MEYHPIEKKETLLLGSGRSIIVTGWTPAEIVKKRVEERGINYACIGNLYNAHFGLNPLIINLLANPYPYPIHILCATKQDKVSQSGEALYNLLHHNLREHEDKWEVLSESGKKVIGSVNKIFSLEDLQSLTNPVMMWDDLNKLCWHLSNEEDRLIQAPLLRKPKIYSLTHTSCSQKPSKFVGHNVEGDSIEEVWVNAVHRIRKNGIHRGELQELLGIISVIRKPWLEGNSPIPRDNLDAYCEDFVSPRSHEGVAYTYGNRMRRVPQWTNLDTEDQQYLDQLEATSLKLAHDPNSKRAVVSLWTPTVDISSNQPPCLNHIHFSIAEGKLNVIATYRSHDIFTAYYANAVAIARLQKRMTDEIKRLNPSLELEQGALMCNSQCAHIYRWCLPQADKLISECYHPREQYEDAVGNFIISLCRSGASSFLEIVHLSPQGETLKVYKYEGKLDPLRIVRALYADNPSILATHLAYLGVEIERASRCQENGIRYSQDAR